MTTSRKPKLKSKIGDPYEQFISELRLVNVGLQSCSANLDRKAYYDAVDADKSLPRTLTSTYSVAKLGKEYFDCDGAFKVTLEKNKHGTENIVLFVECVFRAHIHVKGSPIKELVERFAQEGLRLILVPFARQFISDTTARMVISPVVIPLTSQAVSPLKQS